LALEKSHARNQKTTALATFRIAMSLVFLLSFGASAHAVPATQAAERGAPGQERLSSAKRLCEDLGAGCRVAKIMYWQVRSLFFAKPEQGLYWLYIISALSVAMMVYALGLPRLRDFSVTGCLHFIFPNAVYRHASAVTDYKYYITTGFVDPFLTLVIAGGTAIPVSSRVSAALNSIVGPLTLHARPGWIARLAYTVLLVAAIDLGYFIFHYLAHRIEFLWEFHKVHHAAEVLTPITGYRNHPIDSLLQLSIIGGIVGFLNGVMTYWYQRPPDLITVLNTSVVLFAYNLTTNLRHSHVWLSYGNIASHILSSPAQHQIHHSCEVRHLDTNFGRVLSLWDWMSGTLYIPTEKEEFRLGLRHEEHREYVSLWGCYVLPFIKAFRGLTKGRPALDSKGDKVVIPQTVKRI